LSGPEREEGAKTIPRFSIIITFHNQRDFIKDALHSALSQRNADFEVIVVDDASVDGSQEILKQYGDAIRLLCLEKNAGACAARNQGVAMATGEYLVFLDGDDAFLPWALEVYEKVAAAKRPKLMLCSMRWFQGTMTGLQPGEAPREITVVDYEDYLRRDRGFGHSASALVIARQAFEDVHGWLVGFFPAEDNDLALRLSVAGRTIQILTPPTTWHRAHASNSINNILSFMPAMDSLLRREREGCYPGGKNRQFARRALIGGMTFHWTKRAAKGGLYGHAVKLFTKSSPMLFATIVRRLGVILGGRQPIETLKL
jgi:glycosyltransferase involved in cell wall biosynthesis